jgi:hypothetical protein
MGLTEMNKPTESYIAPLILISWLILWCFVVPLLLMIVHGLIQNRWMLQNTSRVWSYTSIAAAVWFLTIAVPLVFWFKWSDIPWRILAGLAAWSLLGGWHWGYFALNLMNHSSAPVGQPVEFKIVHHLKGTVEIRAVGEAYDGITFRYSTSLWRDHGGEEKGTAPGLVYRGRLGLLWGEFRDQ